VTTQSAATATLVARTPIVFFFMARPSSPFNYSLRREFLGIAAHYFSAIAAAQQSPSSPRTKRWRRRTSLFLRQWKNRWFAPQETARRVQMGVCSNADNSSAMKKEGFSYEYHYRTKEGLALADFKIATCE
jgi:hypothetical protein